MQNKPPKITVIIPTFNRAQFLAECLDSILVQTLPAHQIIVVNDGSTDDTKKVCDRYRDKIEYWELNQRGKPSAINLGLEKTTGDYVWIFDDDDVAFPEALARFVEPLEKNFQYGFSYSTFFYTGTDPDGRLGEVIRELKIPDLERKGFLPALLEWNFLGGAALFARTACYKEAGHFDPELLRSQDYEMAIRIARRFKGIFINGRPTFHYRQHEGARGAMQDRFAVIERDPKWLEYNQKFFRRLYEEMPLEEYLPPPADNNKVRQAILKRMEIMSYKFLLPEVTKDLVKLAALDDQSPFSFQENTILWDMIARRSRYYGMPTLNDNMEFFAEVRRLSRSSAGMRFFRAKITRILLLRFRDNPKFGKIPGIMRRVFHLYLG